MAGGALIALMLVAAAGAQEGRDQSTAAAKAALSSAAGKALQGDATQAVVLLREVPETEFAAGDRAVRNCMIARFGAPAAAPASDGAITEQVLSVYRAYWHASLVDPGAIPAEEEKLGATLARLAELPATADWAQIETEIKARIRQDGFEVLMGRTPPLLELMVWKVEDKQRREVQLPEGPFAVEVRTLDGFESLGWSAFATCDRSFTGGWVGEDAIYAVKSGWKSLESENFAVSFLAHETQHFADKARFGELQSWELEYRAKLAEIALADETTARLLTAFSANQGSKPDVPHSYANWVVLTHLRSELGLPPAADLSVADRARLKSAARSLLERDSAHRLNREPASAAARR